MRKREALRFRTGDTMAGLAKRRAQALSMSLQIILVPVGTSGDVLPFIAIGLMLKSRGHRVVMIASGAHRALIEAAGIDLIESIGADADAAAFAHPNFWRPTRGFRRISERVVVPSLRTQIAAIQSLNQPGKTVVVGSTLALGARIACEKPGEPLVTLHLAPAAIRSLDDTPHVANIRHFPRLPRSARRLLYWYFDRFIAEPVLTRGLNQVRSEMGLAPIRRPLHEWLHSPTRVIGLFPAWFAAPAADWPKQVRLTGFPLYDGPGRHALAPDLVRFLDQGEPPVVFTAGTGMRHAQQFFRAALEACATLAMRGVLISASAEQLPSQTPASVKALSYAPFGILLPRVRALVHHGGIGTSAQALRAGIAQVVIPLAYDQTDNAARLKRLGVASVVSQRAPSAARLASVLRKLLARPDLQARLSDAAGYFKDESALAQTCQLIEEAARESDSQSSESRS
jgi:rhamnosyltransferase subunit B